MALRERNSDVLHARFRQVSLLGWVLLALSASAQAGNQLDQVIRREQQHAVPNLKPMPVVNDAVFLRRVYVDLIGRIPTAEEVREFSQQPAADRRDQLVKRLLADERFADRWTLFFADMLRLRSQAPGGAALFAWVHNAMKTGMPYDEMARRLISTNGKAGKIPESGFILADDADPLAMASITSQVFLGVRIGCAQCHDHPFDEWKRRDFYDLAAFYGKTRRFESQLTRVVYATETAQTSILWPPEGVGPESERKPIPPRFPFLMAGFGGDSDYLQRLEKVRTAKRAVLAPAVAKGPSVDDLLNESADKLAKATSGSLAEELTRSEAKKEIRRIDLQKGMYQPSELREELARLITDPKNAYFPRALVNRVWKTLVGRGFVEPVDDFREDNPPAIASAMDYLSQEFVASDYDLRTLIQLIVTSDAYQREHAPGDSDEQTRTDLEANLLATPVRRMIAESLYDSIVTAGHLFEPKHSPGKNEKTIYDIVRVPKAKANAEGTGGVVARLAGNSPAPGAMAGPGEMVGGGGEYGLESAIELDFNALLNQPDDEEVALDEMKAMSKEEIEAQRMTQMRMSRASAMEYEEKQVPRVVDDNPVFNTSLRMQSPAPDGHFLRVFGQPNRTELGDLRDDSASMRQSLMMLNGRITHEASRVGDLESIHALLVGPKANSEEAIRLAYLEVLTRRPSAEELAEAREMLDAAASPLDGMADLRWVLMNSHEFRFLP